MTQEHLVLRRAFDLLPELIVLRRELHRRPELAFSEHETSALARRRLEHYIPDVTAVPVAGTGMLAHRARTRPAVVLRACLDALPVEEETGAEYASLSAGKCHACGHDAQVAALVGAMAILAADDPRVPVAALFQPAEETDQGALAVLGDRAFRAVGPIGAVLGIHGHPGLEAGQVAVVPGPVMACITTVRCEVHGRGGHGAEPHLAPDAMTAAASLVVDWQVGLARRVDPRRAVVLSVGRIGGGATSNVIPPRVEIDGTLRYLDPALSPTVADVLRGAAAGVEARFGVKVRLDLEEVVPALVNDPGLTRHVVTAAERVLGKSALVQVEPSLGGDDFARYGEHFPSCYVFVGERQLGRATYGWHDPSYDIDERSIAYAAAVLAAAALTVAKEVDHVEAAISRN
jgi:amidohydrolase